MSSRPRIALCGATGRTGNAVAHALVARDDVDLVALVAPSVATTPSRALPDGVPAFATLTEAIEAGGIDVIVDLTHAGPALEHLELALAARIPVVVGATGFDDGELESIGARFKTEGLGVFLVPNFSLGAVLAMRVAEQLAAHFPDVEVVETHHDGKRDAPSGTAVHTARRIAAARRDAGLAAGIAADTAGESRSRGESIEGVAVHALRLPGATAHQEVVFGAPGELLTIRHDAIDRSCYAAGVALAARGVTDMQGLETGLEHVL
ncbi:MAG: dihydrodipicolinate reductase [Thermoleophilia bacterium]|nr:dihydrodipicolinate reductase [Thermoleophilia bacterium]